MATEHAPTRPQQVTWRGFSITIAALERPYFEAAAQGRLIVQSCSACGTVRYPVADRCPKCGSRDWDWREASGRGTVASCLVIEHSVRPEQLPAPYATGLVELDDFVNDLGDSEQPVRILTNIYQADGERFVEEPVPDGTPVEVFFEPMADGLAVPQFKLVEEAGPR
jgi:uncharacterized protein